MVRAIDVTLDCHDVEAQARFWAAALGYRPHGSTGQYRSLVPDSEAAPADTAAALPKMVLQQVDDPAKQTKNRLHLDLIVGGDVEAEATRHEALGARRLTDRIAEAGTAWIVMADPEGNEYCLCVH